MGKTQRTVNIRALFPDIYAGCGKSAERPARNRRSRLFRLISGWLRKGSLTLEAAISIPLFLMMAAGLICLLNLYGLQAKKTVELQVRAEKTAKYISAAGDQGVHIVDLKEPAGYQPVLFPFSAKKIKAACRGRVRPWIGADEQEADESRNEDVRMVYVTDYESVYHTSSKCSHLDLQASGVSRNKVGKMRNDYGNKYQACDKCIGKGEEKPVVYVSAKGKCFHNNPECSGLTRHTRMVRETDTKGIRECSRCAAESSKNRS